MSKNSSPLRLLEQRQLAKVEPLERPSLAGVDPKIARSLIRVYRKELKQRQQAVYIDAAKEVGLGSVAATIYSGGQIVKSTIDGSFGVLEGMVENPDPLVFGLTSTAAIIIFGKVVASLPSWFLKKFPFLTAIADAFSTGLPPGLEKLTGAVNNCLSKLKEIAKFPRDAEILVKWQFRAARGETAKTLAETIIWIESFVGLAGFFRKGLGLPEEAVAAIEADCEKDLAEITRRNTDNIPNGIPGTGGTTTVSIPTPVGSIPVDITNIGGFPLATIQPITGLITAEIVGYRTAITILKDFFHL